MKMYKLEQNKGKSPTFASCHAPARTLRPDTPRAAWATCDDPREWLWGQRKRPAYPGLGGTRGVSWAPAQVGPILGACSDTSPVMVTCPHCCFVPSL